MQAFISKKTLDWNCARLRCAEKPKFLKKTLNLNLPLNLTVLSKCPGLDIWIILISSSIEITCMEIALWAKDIALAED